MFVGVFRPSRKRNKGTQVRKSLLILALLFLLGTPTDTKASDGIDVWRCKVTGDCHYPRYKFTTHYADHMPCLGNDATAAALDAIQYAKKHCELRGGRPKGLQSDPKTCFIQN